MKERFNKLIRGEAFKMRDVAFGPSVAVVSAFPVVLIVAVCALAIYAVVKIVRISKNKKNKDE